MAVAERTSPEPTNVPETRRERLRRELTAEMVAIARRHLREGGRAGVSWRGIAREVGMNPASLYTYFDSLDDVFTAIILDSFQRLGSAVQQAAASAADTDPRDRLMACALAYRTWALEHPAEFNLIFTDQIPGYAAPTDGPTVEIQSTIFGPMIDAINELTGTTRDTRAADETLRDDQRSIGLWGMMHGLVMLEINHHLPFVDDVESVFVDSLRRESERLDS
jgi:AcrR family transcriptional regulator